MTLLDEYKISPKKLNKLGLSHESKFLGSGIDGDVYESGRFAIKICGLEEAKIARKLIGTRSQYLVKIYSVTRLRKGLYAIKMERLTHKGTLKHPEKNDHVKKGVKYLTGIGYRHIDLHSRNVMFCEKTKKHKIIDVASLRKVKNDQSKNKS